MLKQQPTRFNIAPSTACVLMHFSGRPLTEAHGLIQPVLFTLLYKLFQGEKCLFLYNHKDRLGYKFQNQKLTSTLLRYNANSVLSSAFLFFILENTSSVPNSTA